MFNTTKRKYNDHDYTNNNDFKKTKYYNDNKLFNLNSNKRKYSDYNDTTTNLIVKIQKVGLENINRDNLIKLNDIIINRTDYLNSQIQNFKEKIIQKENYMNNQRIYEIEDILSNLSDNPVHSKTYNIPENDSEESSQNTLNPMSQDDSEYYQTDDQQMLNVNNIKQQLSYAVGTDIKNIISEPINIQPEDENVTKTYLIIQLFFYFMKILVIISKFVANASISTLIILKFIAIYIFIYIRQLFSVFINAPLHMKIIFIIGIYSLYVSNEYVAKIMDVILNTANFSLEIVGFPQLFSINFWQDKLELIKNEIITKTTEAVDFMINTVQVQAIIEGFNELMKNIMENTQATQSAAEVYKMAVETTQNMINAQQTASQVCQAASEVITENIGTLTEGIHQNMETTSQLTNAISQNIVASTQLTHAIEQQPYNNIISNSVSGAAVAGLKAMGGIRDMLGIGGRAQAAIGLGGNFKRRKNKTRKYRKRRKTNKRQNLKNKYKGHVKSKKVRTK